MTITLHTDFETLEANSNLLKTMGHPIRLAIVGVLSMQDAMTVTEIYTVLEIEQAIASHHLRLMKNARLVNSSKDGKNVYYSLTGEHIKTIYKATFNQ